LVSILTKYKIIWLRDRGVSSKMESEGRIIDLIRIRVIRFMGYS